MTTIAHRRDPPKTPFHAATTTLPSSSPAFATPAHPPRPRPDRHIAPTTHAPAPILPVLIPTAILRPLAFRTFTKKHNLTLTTSALNLLASFIGKHCGSGWREEGLAEGVLDEVARMWRRERGDAEVIVDGEKAGALKGMLKMLEGGMVGGRVVVVRKGGTLSRQMSLVGGDGLGLQREESFGMSGLEVGVNEEDDAETDAGRDVRRWLKVVDAFGQPRMVYNATKKHFEKSKTPSTFFPQPTQKTDLFRQRYYILHQRVLRNEAFQRSSTTTRTQATSADFRITPIANLLGRSGTPHLLLGLLTIAPTGTLALNDPTGSIALDLEHATSIESGATSWLCPGMIVLVDGVYEEEYNSAGGGGILGSVGGIGGTIGGRFLGLSVGAPRCETRAATLGLTDNLRGHGLVSDHQQLHIGGGFGWVDFLGIGSERAVGSRMRKIEQRILHSMPKELEFSTSDIASTPTDPPDTRLNSTKFVVLGEVNLDDPRTLSALRRILLSYTQSTTSTSSPPSPPPLAFILLGNFVSRAALADTTTTRSTTSSSHNSGSSTIPDSITYKEHFDAFAALLADFPLLLRSCTWLFVPGDNDPWPSSFSAGAAVPLPRAAVPDMFTSRVRRAFAAANAEGVAARERTMAGGGGGRDAAARVPGEAVWTTNPSRVSLFGPNHEIVVFRDDVSGRLRRNAISLKNNNATTTNEQDSGIDEEQERDGIDTDEVAVAEVATVDSDAMDIDTSEPPTTTTATSIPQPQMKPRLSPTTTTTSATARSLTKTLLDQSHLSPFPLSLRPLHWSFAHSLSLYPLPTALVLCDAEVEAFACGYQGCCVVNAGRLVGGRGRESAGRGREEVRWVEVDVYEGRGVVRVLES